MTAPPLAHLTIPQVFRRHFFIAGGPGLAAMIMAARSYWYLGQPAWAAALMVGGAIAMMLVAGCVGILLELHRRKYSAEVQAKISAKAAL